MSKDADPSTTGAAPRRQDSQQQDGSPRPSSDDQVEVAAGDEQNSDGREGWVEKNLGWLIVLVVLLAVGAGYAFDAVRDESVSGWIKATIFVIAAFLVAVVLIAGLRWIRRRFSEVEQWTNAIGLAALGLLFGVIPVLVFARGEQVFLLELVVIVLLAMVPGFLYLQFLGVRGQTLWEEFVTNITRLDIAEYGELPVLGEPVLSSNLYAQKFQAVYGLEDIKHSGRRSQGETLIPMLWLTVVVAIGWTLVMQPEPLRSAALVFKDVNAALPTLNAEAIAVGFVGAYFFVVQMIVRRYFQDDLKADAYVNALQRIISVVLIVGVLALVWPQDWSDPVLLAVAFFIGIFPQIGLDLIWEVVKRSGVRALRPSLESEYPLSELDGLNVFYESRLLEEGIEDMQNLATADLVSLMLQTRIPLGRLVDWIDQCLLNLHLPPKKEDEYSKERLALRLYGIRTATNLIGAWKDWSGPVSETGLLGGGASDTAVRVETIITSLHCDPNLRHVIAWKVGGNVSQNGDDEVVC